MVDKPQPLDSRKAIFVGGVPRPLKASELAEVMEEKYGNVTFVGIDCDNDLKYPKGECRDVVELLMEAVVERVWMCGCWYVN